MLVEIASQPSGVGAVPVLGDDLGISAVSQVPEETRDVPGSSPVYRVGLRFFAHCIHATLSTLAGHDALFQPVVVRRSRYGRSRTSRAIRPSAASLLKVKRLPVSVEKVTSPRVPAPASTVPNSELLKRSSAFSSTRSEGIFGYALSHYVVHDQALASLWQKSENWSARSPLLHSSLPLRLPSRPPFPAIINFEPLPDLLPKN